ncbi:hypothetical protein [Aquabacter cavernae]|nr:hypothetical protein [Aquabacter cavernae]
MITSITEAMIRAEQITTAIAGTARQQGALSRTTAGAARNRM